MTASLLIFYIFAAILVQLAVAVCVGFLWRRPAEPGTNGEPPETPSLDDRGAWFGWRKFRVLRRDFEDPGQTQCSFYLVPVDGLPLPGFKPGQFLTVRLAEADGVTAIPGQGKAVIRCYSLSDRPLTEAYRITIKRVLVPPDRPELPPGIASARLHDTCREGDIIEVKAPAGRFVLDPDPQASAVLIAGGIGLTPMMSMLRWCLVEQPLRQLHLFYGVRNAHEHAFRQTLLDMAAAHANLHLTVVYSRPEAAEVLGRDYQHHGHIDIELLKRMLPQGRHHFYVCGPAPMMEGLIPALRAWGVAAEDLHFEAFGPASVKSEMVAVSDAAQIGDAAFDITFRRAGRTLRWDGRDETLLDFAERHGIVVEQGCRAGSCGSCETELVSGTVRYASPPGHKIAHGNCLLCVGIPTSSLLLEA